eukprot:4087935-Pleurochrysis_carterae.AAC.1
MRAGTCVACRSFFRRSARSEDHHTVYEDAATILTCREIESAPELMVRDRARLPSLNGPGAHTRTSVRKSACASACAGAGA